MAFAALTILYLIVGGVLMQFGIQIFAQVDNTFHTQNLPIIDISSNAAVASSTGPPSMDVTSGDDYIYLHNGINTRAAEMVASTSSSLYNLPVTGLNVTLTKLGNPKGNLTFGVWDENGNLLKQFGQDMNATSLTGSDAAYVKTGSAYNLTTNDRIGVRYHDGGNSSSNYALKLLRSNSQYVNYGDILRMNTSDWTMTAWAKFYDYPAVNTTAPIITKRVSAPSTNPGYSMQMTSAGKFQGSIGDGTGTVHSATSSTILSTNQFYFLANVIDRSSTIQDFINCGLDREVDISDQQGSIQNTDSFRIGRGSGNSGNYMNGVIDEVRIYNVAKTQAELCNIYHGGTDNVGLIGYWKFDEGSGTTAIDSYTPSGHNGTLTNNPAWLGSNVNDNVKIKIATDGSFDSTYSILSTKTVSSNWANFIDYDMVASVNASPLPAGNTLDGSTTTFWQNAIVQESDGYIFFNLGQSRIISCLALLFPDSEHIPGVVNIYVSDSPTIWGNPVITTVPLQNEAWQTIVISDDDSVRGQYIKVEVDDWGTAQSIKLAEVLVSGVDSSATSYIVTNSVSGNIWSILNIVSYGILLTGVLMTLVNVKEHFF